MGVLQETAFTAFPVIMTESQYRRQTLDKGPRGESKGSGGVFQGTPAGSQFQHQVEAGKRLKGITVLQVKY